VKAKAGKAVSRAARRGVLRAGGGEAAGSANIYARIGVRPFINLTGSLSINGGLLIPPGVKLSMEEASRHSVSIDELMEKVGQRLARLLGCESGIVTSGCAAALTHATAACVAGADPESIRQLPNLSGLRDEVIMPRQSRTVYDHAIRAVGVKIVTVSSREEFHRALGSRTAMIAVMGFTVMGSGAAEGTIRLEEMAEAGRKLGVPVLVDAAPEIPRAPNPYLSRGAGLVAYSGGKFMTGPQCAGLLLGRKELIRAAWVNSAPHHAFGRASKVGKEEIMGMLAAVEALVKQRDIEAERRTWEAWLARISEKISSCPGVQARIEHATDATPHPVLHVQWDAARIGLTAGEVHRLLLDGEPRIMSLAAGAGHSFTIRAPGMKPGDPQLVAVRLHDLFSQAPGGGAEPAPVSPAVNVAGKWDVQVEFAVRSSRHTFLLQTNGARVTGRHVGRSLQGELSGKLNGGAIWMQSLFDCEGAPLAYVFTGCVTGDQMSGELDLGQYGQARWSARRDSLCQEPLPDGRGSATQ
jgi:L-seryl-tRNA(Ser) seleniumtransferase